MIWLLTLLSLEEKIDTNAAAGELVVHVFGAIAYFERRLIAERTKDGIAAARRSRQASGTPAPVADYRRKTARAQPFYRELSRSGIERMPQPA